MAAKGNRAPTQRQLRVGEEIRHILANVLSRGELRDPVLHDVSLTVTEVRPSPDMKNATVFVMPLGGGHVGEIVDALNRAAGFLRGQVGRELTMKFTPSLRFVADESFDAAQRVDEALKDPHVAQDLQHDPSADDGE